MNSLLGSLVGDAAGATLEFHDDIITEDIALHAMKMPGGGSLRVGPGQITDDGELTLSLFRALNLVNGSKIPINSMIYQYQQWYASSPFDIGRTCSTAFEIYDDYSNGDIYTTIEDCKHAILKFNGNSEANGALMRATAIPTWVVANNESVDLAITLAKEDALLSHPSIVCQETNAIYVFAITHLLQGISPSDTLQLVNKFIELQITSEKVKTWYFKESLNINDMLCTAQIGHVRWGFILAMYFLRNPEIMFEEAIKITLMKGGDTDTNAAIVGGLVGAYHSIPKYMLRPVLEFDCTKLTNKYPVRPAEYSVKKVIAHLI